MQPAAPWRASAHALPLLLTDAVGSLSPMRSKRSNSVAGARVAFDAGAVSRAGARRANDAAPSAARRQRKGGRKPTARGNARGKGEKGDAHETVVWHSTKSGGEAGPDHAQAPIRHDEPPGKEEAEKNTTKTEHIGKHSEEQGDEPFQRESRGKERPYRDTRIPRRKKKEIQKETSTEQRQDGIDDRRCCGVRGVPRRSDQMLAMCTERAARRTVGI